MESDVEDAFAFVDEVRRVFAFLETAGFELESAKQVGGYAPGQLVTMGSSAVVFEIELDNRGTVNAIVSRRADPVRQVQLAKFAERAPGSAPASTSEPGSVIYPPYSFNETTTRERALELLADFTREHAVQALTGDIAIFREAIRRS